MALTNLFVATDGDDANAGSSEVLKANGTSADVPTDTNGTIDLSDDTPSLVGVNVDDTIRLTGQTGGINGTAVYLITAVDVNLFTVDVSGTTSAADPVVWAIGGPLLTISEAKTIAGGDAPGVQVNIAPGTYAETVAITEPGAAPGTVVYKGYVSQPNETVPYGTFPVIIDATGETSGVASAIGASQIFHRFENISVENATGVGWDLSPEQSVVYVNCRAKANGGIGFNMNIWHLAYRCQALDNGSYGFDFPSSNFRSNGVIYGCLAAGNVTAQIRTAGADIIGCIASNLQSDGVTEVNSTLILATSSTTNHFRVYHCTLDGRDQAASVGVDLTRQLWLVVLIGNIVANCNTGFLAITTDLDEIFFTRSNVFYNNTTDRTLVPAAPDDLGDVDPLFADPDSYDYTPRAYAVKNMEVLPGMHPGATQTGVSAAGGGGLGIDLGRMLGVQ